MAVTGYSHGAATVGGTGSLGDVHYNEGVDVDEKISRAFICPACQNKNPVIPSSVSCKTSSFRGDRPLENERGTYTIFLCKPSVVS